MKRINQLALNDDGFAFDPTTGESFTLNHTGLFIVRALQENQSPAQISEQLIQNYDVGPEKSERDILDFISQLEFLRLA